jgi:hypothetical protein
MGKLVVLTFAEGDLDNRGFPVTLQMGDEGKPATIQETGFLQPNPELVESYTSWRSTYDSYMGVNSRLEKPAAQITNFSVADVRAVSQKLIIAMNQWLRSPQFMQIWETLLTSLDPSTPIRFVIQALDIQIKRLPWNQWDLLERYLHVEITISKPCFNTIQSQKKSKSKNNKVNILAILGNNDNIDINQDKIAIQKIKGAEPHFLVKPNRSEGQPFYLAVREARERLQAKERLLLFLSFFVQLTGEMKHLASLDLFQKRESLSPVGQIGMKLSRILPEVSEG